MKESWVIFPLFGFDEMALRIQEACHFEAGIIKQHQFPDGETVFKIETEITNRPVIFIASLDLPNPKIMPLLLAAETARFLGASKIVLIAPYLAYMRQDKIFEQGQGITSAYFAKLLSHYFDGLITVDPHLHRWHSLSAIYDIPTAVAHAAQPVADWIHYNVPQPLLIGPDKESRQWVKGIADQAHSPFLILEKHRKGDASVEISIPEIDLYKERTPVLIDDIVSTGMTMIETVMQLHALKMPPPICIGVHALFIGDAYPRLLAAGVDKIITCNTIPHCSNEIDISSELIRICHNLLEEMHL
jgi:ribose-phosphate pyrophosphokinase